MNLKFFCNLLLNFSLSNSTQLTSSLLSSPTLPLIPSNLISSSSALPYRNLSRNSNGHNISLRCSIRGHNISRRSKLNNGCSREIRTTITFYSDVGLSTLISRDAREWKEKLWGNSNDNNFWLGCPIVSRSISRRSKFKTEAIWKIYGR